MLLLKNGNNRFVTGALVHLQEAIFKEQQQDFAGAILEYQDALRYDSTASIAYYGMAENYLKVRKEERAGIGALVVDAPDLGPVEARHGDVMDRVPCALRVADEPLAVRREVELRRFPEVRNDRHRQLSTLLGPRGRVGEQRGEAQGSNDGKQTSVLDSHGVLSLVKALQSHGKQIFDTSSKVSTKCGVSPCFT